MQVTTMENKENVSLRTENEDVIYWGYLQSKDVLDVNGKYVGTLRGVSIADNWTIPEVVIEIDEDYLDDMGLVTPLFLDAPVNIPSIYVRNERGVVQLTTDVITLKEVAIPYIPILEVEKTSSDEIKVKGQHVKEKVNEDKIRAKADATRKRDQAKATAQDAKEKARTNANQVNEKAKTNLVEAKKKTKPENVRNEARTRGEALGAKVGNVKGVTDEFKTGFKTGMGQDQ